MRELSHEREVAAEQTLNLISEALEHKTDRGVLITSEVKLRELDKTAELLESVSHSYRYNILSPSVVKIDSIRRIQYDEGLAVPVTIMPRNLFTAARTFNNAIIICDINPIVAGGGFRVGDDSNESQLCRYSTLYQELNSKSVKMRYYYSNATTGRWAQDSIVLIPEVLFFSEENTTPKSRNIVLGFSPPNMSVTSTQLKLSARTSEHFHKRVQAAFDLALSIAIKDIKIETLIVPVLGYKTFGLPARMCAKFLVDQLNRISTTNIANVVLVIDDETRAVAEYILPRLTNMIYR